MEKGRQKSIRKDSEKQASRNSLRNGSVGSSRGSLSGSVSGSGSSGSRGLSHGDLSNAASSWAKYLNRSEGNVNKDGGSSSSCSSSSSSGSSKKSAEAKKDEDEDEENDENKYPWLDDEDALGAAGKEDDTNFRDSPDYNYIQTYEDYLDHYVTWKDLYYFESDEIARTITTLGFRVPELLTKDQFNKMMANLESERYEKRRDDVHLALDVPEEEITCPLMQSLAEREVQNRTGNLSCLIYIRTFNTKNQEVSGWIDFRLRLKSDEKQWLQYFSGKKRLIPRPSDLCYYNWATFQVRFNSSENYLVTTDINEGLQFLNKADRKLITVNPYTAPGDNTFMTHVASEHYLDCAIYDHYLRIKA